jgi:antitoxin (DNA-binding transcriptional repressor) of toxin-antitoxin stability system
VRGLPDRARGEQTAIASVAGGNSLPKNDTRVHVMCYCPPMAQKGDRRRGKPLNPDLGYTGDPVHHATSNLPSQRIGIRELRQHASVYVDLVERGYTVDITNRGRLVAQMIPVRDPESPLERWIAKGVIERAEDEGSVLEIEPYPSASAGQPSASHALEQLRATEEGERP